jgi:hypothetical protein
MCMDLQELIRLKKLAKQKKKELAQGVSVNSELIHHSYSCDSCRADPIVGVRKRRFTKMSPLT